MTVVSANSTYFSRTYWETLRDKSDLKASKAFESLRELIQRGDLSEFKRSPHFVSGKINERHGPRLETLLHLAYTYGKDEFVEFLKSKGALETIQDANGSLPNASAVFNRLCLLIQAGDLSKFKECKDFNPSYINNRFGLHLETLLHRAYAHGKSEFVVYLKSLGASETIPDAYGALPIDEANVEYEDDLPNRVVNDVALSYLKAHAQPDAHKLFDFLVDYLKERCWTYVDQSQRGPSRPFREGPKLTLFGDPALAYHVNSSDVSLLFKRSAKKIGLVAETFWFRGNRRTIPRGEKERAGIIGEMRMLNSPLPLTDESELQFRSHTAAFCNGWYFDLLFQCKYQNRFALLDKLVRVPPPLKDRVIPKSNLSKVTRVPLEMSSESSVESTTTASSSSTPDPESKKFVASASASPQRKVTFALPDQTTSKPKPVQTSAEIVKCNVIAEQKPKDSSSSDSTEGSKVSIPYDLKKLYQRMMGNN